MSRYLLACAVAVSPLLAGCTTNYQGPRQDPFANVGFDSAPIFPELRLAYVLSENTKKSLQLTYQFQGNMFAKYDAREYVDKMFAVYKRNFKTAVQVERAADARQVNADLIAVIDDYYPKLGIKSREEAAIIFLTLDGQKIDEIKASFEKVVGLNAQKDTDLFSNAINGQLEAGMRKSQALADFAKAKAGEPRAQAPVASAPAPKLYHSDVDRPGYSAPENADNFALVVGIEKYATLPDADFAERDASSVREHLLALGYPERNVVFIKGSQAGKAGIEKYVESWLPRNVTEKSRVFIYFSGHGAPDPATGQGYLVPWDGDAKFLENTGYSLRRLYEKLNALKAREVLVAMDACFSGSGGRSVIAKGTRPLVLKIDEGTSVLGRAVVLAAAGADEVTGTEESQGHGLFTYHLLKGLQERSGKATVKDLYDYLRPKVQDAARRQNRDQTPQLMSANSDGAGIGLR